MVLSFLLLPYLMASYSHKKLNLRAVAWSSKNVSQHLAKFFGASWLTIWKPGHCRVPNNRRLSALFFLTLPESMLTDTACWGQTRACTARPQLLHSDLHRRLLPRCLIRNEQCVSETFLCSILFHRQALPKKANSGINLPFKYTGHFVQNQWCDTDQDPDLASEECEPLASKKVDLHRGYHLCNLWSILFNNIFAFDFYWAYPQKWELELTFKTWSVGWLWNQTTKLPKIYMPLARQKFFLFVCFLITKW